MLIRFLTWFFRSPSQAVRIKRFEILLPLNYNDGVAIEPDTFDQTAEELCARFGGVTEDTLRTTRTWKYGGTRYRDELLRFRIDSEDPQATGFFRRHKYSYKERFRQIDIWITAHEIAII